MIGPFTAEQCVRDSITAPTTAVRTCSLHSYPAAVQILVETTMATQHLLQVKIQLIMASAHPLLKVTHQLASPIACLAVESRSLHFLNSACFAFHFMRCPVLTIRILFFSYGAPNACFSDSSLIGGKRVNMQAASVKTVPSVSYTHLTLPTIYSV